jgi:hypothetical protein
MYLIIKAILYILQKKKTEQKLANVEFKNKQMSKIKIKFCCYSFFAKFFIVFHDFKVFRMMQTYYQQKPLSNLKGQKYIKKHDKKASFFVQRKFSIYL